MSNHLHSVSQSEQPALTASRSVVAENRRSFTSAWRDDEAVFLAYACRLCGGNPDHGHDLLSQAVVKLLSYIATHDQPIRHPRALIFRTVKRLGIDQRRRAARERRLYDRRVDPDSLADWHAAGAPSESPQRQAETRQQLNIVYKALGELPLGMRMIFALRFLEDRSYREIAGGLGISEALARKRVQTLRCRLAQALEENDPQGDFHIRRRPAS